MGITVKQPVCGRTSAINIQIRVRRAGQPSHSLHPIHGNAVSSSQNSEARLEMFENEKAPTFRGITFPSQSQADAAEVGCQCQLGRRSVSLRRQLRDSPLFQGVLAEPAGNTPHVTPPLPSSARRAGA